MFNRNQTPSNLDLSGLGYRNAREGSWLLLFTVAIDYFCYYAMRAVLLTFLYKVFSDGDYNSRSVSLYIFLFAASGGLYVLSGWVGDFLIDKRWLMVAGAVLSGCGMWMLSFGGQEGVAVSLLMMVLGVSLYRPQSLAYLGEILPGGTARKDYGYTLYVLVFNIAAFVASVAMVEVLQEDVAEGIFKILGSLMLLNAAVLVAGIMQKWLPKTHSWQEKTNKGARLQWGIGVIVAVVFGYLFIALGTAFWWEEPDATMRTATYEIAGGFFVGSMLLLWLHTARKGQGRSIGLLFLLILTLIFFWTSFEIAGQATYRFFSDLEFVGPFEGTGYWLWNSLMMVYIGIGLVMLWYYLPVRGLKRLQAFKLSFGFSILLGSYILFQGFFEDPAFGLMPYMAFFGLQALAEMLVLPTIYAMVFNEAPRGFKGVAFGTLLAGVQFVSALSMGLAELKISPRNEGADFNQGPEILTEAIVVLLIGSLVLSGAVTVFLKKRTSS
ncbi:MAG: hypothetical protein AAF570_01495 [Bacteroidota bacterium]